MPTETTIESVIALSKRRGFIYPGSEIYGGLANTYDYGPLGAELLRNIKNVWWSEFIQKRQDMVGLDASIISSHQVWDASGHTSGFSDSLADCLNCKARTRADHLIEDYFEDKTEEFKKNPLPADTDIPNLIDPAGRVRVEGLSTAQMDLIISHFHIPCPTCKKHTWTAVRTFNLLFPVNLGIIEGEQSLAYLRGETAQGIFINFKNVVDTNRVRLPFGIGQIGKSFRNEITLGNSIFRTIEFEQAEIEYFFDPETSDWNNLFDAWKDTMWEFVTKTLGINEKNLRWRAHTDEERSFYSRKTEDLEYKYPFGYKELWGLAYRTDYDLKAHMTHSKKDLSILDPHTNKKIVPHVIEPAVGVNRLMLMILCDSYREVEGRTYLALHPRIAPYKVAVFPLVANKPDLIGKAQQVFELLQKNMTVMWDDRGNIGKRYAAQDEIGTPFCITVDYETLENNTVTVRSRDDAQQVRISIDTINEYLLPFLI